MFILNYIWLLLVALGIIAIIVLAWREAFRYKLLLNKYAVFKTFLAVLASIAFIADLILMVIYTGWLSMFTAAIILLLVGLFMLSIFRKQFADDFTEENQKE